jgi:hypothetical protein
MTYYFQVKDQSAAFSNFPPASTTATPSHLAALMGGHGKIAIFISDKYIGEPHSVTTSSLNMKSPYADKKMLYM